VRYEQGAGGVLCETSLLGGCTGRSIGSGTGSDAKAMSEPTQVRKEADAKLGNYIVNSLAGERKEEKMHYANGREAKNGDKVVLLGYGGPTVGILYDAAAGNDYCNGKIAVTKPNDPCPNLKECLHVEDFLALLPAPPNAASDTLMARSALVADISKK